MSMPTIPEEPFRPSKDQVIIDLLKSIAFEETALAHILNAESEKVLALIRNTSSSKELYKAGDQVIKLLDVIVMKEWLLLRKLENVIPLEDTSHHHGDHEHNGHNNPPNGPQNNPQSQPIHHHDSHDHSNERPYDHRTFHYHQREYKEIEEEIVESEEDEESEE